MADNLFNNAAFITLLAAGISIILISLYALRNPPSKINNIYGYRTKRSKQSQEAWKYAQIHGTKRILNAGIIQCFIAILFLFIPQSETVGSLIAVGIIIGSLLISLSMTERDLKNKFG